jgi:predicted transcriptional regulator
MAKVLYLTMCINAELKAKLQKLANEDYRTLTDFIETRLRQIASARKTNRKSLEIVTPPKAMLKTLRPLRHKRTARLTMRIQTDLKAELQELATKQYRTLTDFVEMELYRIVAAPKAMRKRPLPRRQERTAQLSLRINAELKAALLELAKHQNRKLSHFIEIELRQIVTGRKA